MKPLFRNVLIEIFKSDFSAMEMVDDKESMVEKGKVISIGDDVQVVKEGDIIVFKNYNLDEIILDNVKYHIIPEEDIKAICNISTATN